MNDFLESCRDIVGHDHVLTSSEDKAGYETEWRQRFRGNAIAVLRPASTEEVVNLVRVCSRFRIPLVTQGGNTGLVLGSVPDSSGKAVIISLTRMREIRSIDVRNQTITVDAGCTLQQVQNAAAGVQKLFPLSLASEGSCTIGGNLSTNAGGTAVLSYGNTRDLCLGLEVVTADGQIWNGLKSLRKDNTGYDLKDIYIGAEGTLGIITGAVLKLYPQPKASKTAFVALSSAESALHFFETARDTFGPSLTGFELISQICIDLVVKHFQSRPALQIQAPYYALIEISDHESAEHAQQQMESVLEHAYQENLILDAAIAESVSQQKQFWGLRENISMAQAKEGKNIKHDISLPISCIPEFIQTTEKILSDRFPASRIVCFGHLGDGNLHYNISPPPTENPDIFILHQAEINQLVHDQVYVFLGSISAEHGIGELKRNELKRYKSPLELQLMRSIKQALDPENLMNPGKIL